MRFGVFGGSFDPVHQGHLLLAECCREQCKLDEVCFVPAAVSPHKVGSNPVSAEDRVDMLKLAIGGNDSFRVSLIEIERGGVSYTVDTLQALAEEVAGRELFFLMGGDSLVDFPTWREPERICQLATPVVVSRPGSPAPDFSVLKNFTSKKRLEEIRDCAVDMPQIDISSSEIRERISQGRSIRYQTTRAVEQFILANNLYR